MLGLGQNALTTRLRLCPKWARFLRALRTNGRQLLAKSGLSGHVAVRSGVVSKADMGRPITRDISEDHAGLSIPARSSSLGPMYLAGGSFCPVFAYVF